MAETTSRTATYKGKAYRLLWSGKTKFGVRAHLSFMDGSKDFWVDASLVTEGGTSGGSGRGRSRGRRTGCACGSIEGEVRESDCESCRFDELDM